MAYVFCNKLTNATRYVGQYLGPYVDLALAFFTGGLATTYGFNQQPVAHVVHFLLNGAIENVGQVQNAWKNHPDALGRLPQRAVDVTISLDKSFSVLFVVCESHRDALFALAKDAVERVLSALEERCAVARAGPNGDHMPGRWGGLVVPEFTNRNGEIQIHFHVILFIAIECNDGVVRSMDTRSLFAHAKWAGMMLTAELSRSLCDFGLAAETRDGRIAIAGIPQELCDHWSSRRREVVAYGAAHGLTTPKELHRAALASRDRKHRDEPLAEVLARHEAEAQALGFDLRELDSLCFARTRVVRQSLSSESLDGVAAEILARSKPRSSREFEQQIAIEAPRLGIGIEDVLGMARRAAKRLGQSLDDAERELDQRNVEASLASLRKRPGAAATRPALDRAAEKHLLPPRLRVALEVMARKGSAARVLDASGVDERRLVLAALRDALAHSRIDVVSVTLRSADADALRATTRSPVFTAAKAIREWTRAREPRLFENPNEVAFRRIRTDPISDLLAWTFGLRTRREIDWRSWQRNRQPLDLADGPHVLIIDEAHTFPQKVLSEVLDEAERTRATVVLSADLERNRRFCVVPNDRALASPRSPARTSGERELEEVLRLLRDRKSSRPDWWDLGIRQ